MIKHDMLYSEQRETRGFYKKFSLEEWETLHIEVSGFHSERVAMAHMFNLHDIYRGVCKGLTKC